MENINITPVYSAESTKSMLLKRLLTMGTNIKFDNDKWFCDKLIHNAGMEDSSYTVYFTKVPEKYKEIVKWFVLERAAYDKITTISSSLGDYKHFFNFLVEKCNTIDLKNVDARIIKQYELYVMNQELSEKYKSQLWACVKKFFSTMSGWEELPQNNPIKNKKGANPFKISNKDRKVDSKMIPQYVCIQLDKIFLSKKIPIYVRLAYWLMRAIPSRVTEITGMKIDCLKPSYDGNYVIFIPSWKQNGGNMDPEIRSIFIKQNGEFEKFLISMIKEQIELSKSLQEESDVKDYLFTVKYKKRITTSILKKQTLNAFFKEICKEENVVDENGNPYTFTTHQLRHNGITDRIYYGFTFLEIRDMTNHKGNSMIWNSYFHSNKEKTLENQRVINNKSNEGISEISRKPIMFSGRIHNIDKSMEERLLKNPRAVKLMDGKENFGICSDITGCKSKLYECFACDYFIPNADDLDYFKNQVKVWEHKKNLFATNSILSQKAEHNLSLHRKVVERIEKEMIKLEE